MKIKTTFIVRNLTDETLACVEAMSASDAFDKLAKWAQGDLRHCVSRKDGDGSFRDRVDINRILRNRDSLKGFKIESRRGYKLVAFEIEGN